MYFPQNPTFPHNKHIMKLLKFLSSGKYKSHAIGITRFMNFFNRPEFKY
jgi:hypothetical protein